MVRGRRRGSIPGIVFPPQQRLYPVSLLSDLPGGKWPKRAAGYSPSAISEVKDTWNYNTMHPYVFVTFVALNTAKEQLYLVDFFVLCPGLQAGHVP